MLYRFQLQNYIVLRTHTKKKILYQITTSLKTRWSCLLTVKVLNETKKLISSYKVSCHEDKTDLEIAVNVFLKVRQYLFLSILFQVIVHTKSTEVILL